MRNVSARLVAFLFGHGLASLVAMLCLIATPASAQSYRVIKLEGVSADSAIDLFGGGAGGLAGVNATPNDAGVAFGISNYTRAGVRKLGIFRYASGKWYLVREGMGPIIVSNDSGDALVRDPVTTEQYFVSYTGAIQALAPSTPSVSLKGITNDGRFWSGETFFSSDFGSQTTIPGPWSGYGRDGLLFSSGTQTVRFADGTTSILPCNIVMPPKSLLTRPASGRNCYASAASSNGIVAGLFYSADGRQGIFRFSKSGFDEVVIDSQYWGTNPFALTSSVITLSPTEVTGVANDGTVLLEPSYPDEIRQTCTGGPYVVRGSVVTDLKQFIPGNSCFNISAGISGGGRIFMSSQFQGLSLYMEPTGTSTTGSPYPVIFVHGINSSSATWANFRDKLINSNVRYGGAPKVSNGSVLDVAQGDFYALDFSSSTGLTFQRQGWELAKIIDEIKRVNNAAKVVLVAHSMGGLAARAYLQGLAYSQTGESFPYNSDVEKLITVGTPHQGSPFGYICEAAVASPICAIMGNDPTSVAMQLLKYDSSALNELNLNMATHGLPPISYVSIVVKGMNLYLYGGINEDGDGIVSVSSQNLASVALPTNISLLHKVLPSIYIDPWCGGLLLLGAESHTCEPSNSSVQDAIISELQGTSLTITAFPTANTVPGWNLVGNSSSGSLNVAAAFGDAAKVSTVWKWIASTSRWAFYAPSLTAQALADYATSKGYDVLTTINGGEGVWINATTAFTAQLPAGTAITSTSFQAMAPGWNLIAIGDNKTPSQFNALVGTATPLTTLWTWDALRTNWYFYAPSLEAKGGTALTDYITSKSYLDFGTKVLDPTTGFWVNKP